jgi:Leucine-rich repeat (LRR) protein
VADNRLNRDISFRQLPNIQYLDVSGNKIESFSSFGELVHLRELTANHCGLFSLEGLQGLPILRLSLDHNELESLVTGEGDVIAMERLEWMSLSHNCVKQITRLDGFPALKALNLGASQILQCYLTRFL